MKIIEHIKKQRGMYLQIVISVLLFSLIGVSIMFMNEIVRRHLVKITEDTISVTKGKIESEITSSKTTFDIFAQTLEDMFEDGDNIELIEKYVKNISSHIEESDIYPMGLKFHFYNETVSPPAIIGADIEVSSASRTRTMISTEHPWEQPAIDAAGEIAEITPYLDDETNDFVFAVSRCIFDGSGNRLGVAYMEFKIDDLKKYMSDMTKGNEGIGILMNQDYDVMLHNNPDFVGKNLLTDDMPFSVFKNEITAGKNIGENDMVNYKGDPSVVFFYKLKNNWYIGLVLPKAPYYREHILMTVVMIALTVVSMVITVIFLIRKQKSDMESMRKSTFLSNMSHEIRTPMNAIISMTRLGKSSDNIERKDYCFGKVEEAGYHLLGVINDILDMSKIESGKYELSLNSFNFERMLQRAVDVAAFTADKKRQTLKVRIDSKIPHNLIGDEQKLRQVITNLLGNAVKFTPEQGSISIDAAFEHEENGVCIIKVAVTDTGIGISPEQQTKLFQAFQQAEANTTRKYGGTGLGLAICKQIVERMGGKIWVESNIGEGSSFIFTVEVERGAADEADIQKIDIKNIRVMAIDDDPDITQYFKEIMREYEISCNIASNGTEALKLIEQKGSCDIYFVDWLMPEMNGIEVAKMIREHSSENTVIIMISAAEWRTIEEKAKKVGVNSFLSKPLFPSDILNAITSSFGVKAQQQTEKSPITEGMFKGCRVLLAEDMEINHEIVNALLENTGLVIDGAMNGKEAVRMFSETEKTGIKYDLILMDVQMPEMDGYNATKGIRGSGMPNAASIPIIAMTANVFNDDIEKCLEAGMNAHVGKPIDLDEVIAVLRKYLKK